MNEVRQGPSPWKFPGRREPSGGGDWLERPVDGASLVAFRTMFGLLSFVLAVRFFTHDWVRQYYETPKTFFSYWGLSWIKPWGAPWMRVHYACMSASALGLAFSPWPRRCAGVFTLLFTYAHFCDQTNYLNHYYLVSLLGLLLTVVPLEPFSSIGSRHRRNVLGDGPFGGSVSDDTSGKVLVPTVPVWALGLVRFQIGIVYFLGGVAKLKPDWLLHAQPLKIWLGASTYLPGVGPLLGMTATAYAMSWAGALFDLTIPLWLSWRRTRLGAYGAVVLFHGITGVLFPIGMFPWIMTLSALVFFPPSWPRRIVARLRGRRESSGPDRRPGIASAPCHEGPPLRGREGWSGETEAQKSEPLTKKSRQRGRMALLVLYGAWQCLLPLRHYLYPGNVLWTEQGFRFAWHVMLMEKTADTRFRVRDRASGRIVEVDPRDYLTKYQTKMMGTQPDMILQMAHVLAEDFGQRGFQEPQVFADALVVLNGRPPARLVNPDVDLAARQDGLGAMDWLLPAPGQPPEF